MLLFEPRQEREKGASARVKQGDGRWECGKKQPGNCRELVRVHLRIFLIPLPPSSLLLFFFCVFLTLVSVSSSIGRNDQVICNSRCSRVFLIQRRKHFAVSFIRIGCRLPVNLRDDLTARRSSDRENCDRINERKERFLLSKGEFT